MDDHISIEFEAMANQLKQHEEIIIQLLEIIGSTNQRVSELANSQKKAKYPQ